MSIKLLTAEDKLEIIELTSRYAIAMDTNDVDMWISTWASDGVWSGRIGQYRGKEELLRLLPDLGERVKGKRHIMTNHVVSAKEDGGAKMTCYLLVVEAKIGGSSTTTGVYEDELKKIDGKWLFSQRVMTLDA